MSAITLTLGKAGGDIERHLESLLGVEAGVAVRMVAAVQVTLIDGCATAQALGDVVASHLQVDATRHSAQLFMHVEEGLHLRNTAPGLQAPFRAMIIPASFPAGGPLLPHNRGCRSIPALTQQSKAGRESPSISQSTETL